MNSTLEQKDFDTLEGWRSAVRESANREFNATHPEVVICELFSLINKTEAVCDCAGTRAKVFGADFICTNQTAFCPVRGAGWPEHKSKMLADFSQALLT